MTKPRSPEPTFSLRLIQPFVEYLRGLIPEKQAFDPDKLDLDPDARIPASVALQMLEGAVLLTGDPDLGLKAARFASQGNYDLLEYTMVSAATRIVASGVFNSWETWLTNETRRRASRMARKFSCNTRNATANSASPAPAAPSSTGRRRLCGASSRAGR